MTGKRAVVTGATGFVGLNLVRALRERGIGVIALHRGSSDLSWLDRVAGPSVERRVADVTDAEAVLRAMPDAPDVVFHVAASTNLWSRRNAEQTRINVEGTRHVVRAARARGARRLVHTSSIAAFGIHEGAIDETTPSNARSSWINYLRTKALAEDEVRAGIAAGLDAVVLNPASILGPYDMASWSTLFRLVHQRRLPGVPPGRGSFCHVHDVVDAHLAAAEHGRTGENYLLGGADATYLDLVREIGRLMDRPVPSEPTPAWQLRAIARVHVLRARVSRRRPAITPESAELVCRRMTCRSDKAARELGYRTRPLAAMVADTYGWMREAGRLG
jgi:nucleoside-diphosphate-sugar epimerase